MFPGTSLLRGFAAALAAFLLPLAVTVAAQPADDDRTLSPYFAVTGAEAGIDALPLKSTRVAPARSVPVIVTWVPPAIGPDVGLIADTVGAAT